MRIATRMMTMIITLNMMFLESGSNCDDFEHDNCNVSVRLKCCVQHNPGVIIRMRMRILKIMIMMVMVLMMVMVMT